MGLAYEIHRAELQREKERQALRDAQLPLPVVGGSKIVGELPHREAGAERFAVGGKIEVTCVKNAVADGMAYIAGNTYNVRIGVALDLFQQHAAVETKKLEWDFWAQPGRILAAEPCDAQSYAMAKTLGALRIVAGCGYDPGNAAFRQHTLTNEFTKHASTFVRWGDTNPFCSLRQIDGDKDLFAARAAVYNADVIHSHVDYTLQGSTGFNWRVHENQLVIRHYHGTRPSGPQWPNLNMLEDDLANVVLVGARLQLCATRPGRFHWLPIAVPVQRLRALVPRVRRPGPFRIAHSPSKRSYKGTEDLINVVTELKAKGLLIDLVLIEQLQYGDALLLKADADLTFDSFWLGIQGSGLEGAAMGQMVIAGDPDVKTLYETFPDPITKQPYVGYCPYTYASNYVELRDAIERAIRDPSWYASERDRVVRYTEQFHDYERVARRYESIIHTEAPQLPNVLTEMIYDVPADARPGQGPMPDRTRHRGRGHRTDTTRSRRRS
jgi:hypothetical protein